MSKTYGHTKSQKEDRFPRDNTLTPYVSDHRRGDGKYTVDLGRGTGISKTGKLVTKNANRSLKKSMRQQSKRMILDELD